MAVCKFCEKIFLHYLSRPKESYGLRPSSDILSNIELDCPMCKTFSQDLRESARGDYNVVFSSTLDVSAYSGLPSISVLRVKTVPKKPKWSSSRYSPGYVYYRTFTDDGEFICVHIC